MGGIFRVSFYLQGLDEIQSYDLFCSYISQDFRGSQKNLQVTIFCNNFAVRYVVFVS